MFMVNGCPGSFVEKCRREAKRVNPKFWRAVPYMAGVSEEFARLLKVRADVKQLVAWSLRLLPCHHQQEQHKADPRLLQAWQSYHEHRLEQTSPAFLAGTLRPSLADLAALLVLSQYKLAFNSPAGLVLDAMIPWPHWIVEQVWNMTTLRTTDTLPLSLLKKEDKVREVLSSSTLFSCDFRTGHRPEIRNRVQLAVALSATPGLSCQFTPDLQEHMKVSQNGQDRMEFLRFNLELQYMSSISDQ
ncbi:unnamed protein product [Schistocephalus solidus]|uniref:GST_C_6 domain-containing protein n=1 Tax=Schistocephalus solidus TaxID=70667 RepID=A0A183SLQ1_SCHSO|nr:unnamed protein product [Schistocephalus solidus]